MYAQTELDDGRIYLNKEAGDGEATMGMALYALESAIDFEFVSKDGPYLYDHLGYGWEFEAYVDGETRTYVITDNDLSVLDDCGHVTLEEVR